MFRYILIIFLKFLLNYQNICIETFLYYYRLISIFYNWNNKIDYQFIIYIFSLHKFRLVHDIFSNLQHFNFYIFTHFKWFCNYNKNKNIIIELR